MVACTVLAGQSALAEPRVVVTTRADGFELARYAVAADAPGSSSALALSRTIYLNKNGVTLTPGDTDARTNRSALAPKLVTIPAWDVPDDVWAETVACMRQLFIPFDVRITETDPGDVPHLEAVFGGKPALMGFDARTAGVSPFSTTCKTIESSIVFTFTEILPQKAQMVCEIMAQEIAHSYGLDHELLAADPMTYLPYNERRSFQNEVAECGESLARPCGLPGFPACRERQNSVALLTERLGAAGAGDGVGPRVDIKTPLHGATVDPGFAVEALVADDVGVRLATIQIDQTTVTSLVESPWVYMTSSDLVPGDHTVTVRAFDGANTTTATVHITVRDPAAAGGCSTGRGSGGLLALLVAVALTSGARTRRRAR